MHPATLGQFTAGHIREPTIEAGDTRRAGNGNAGIGHGARMLWRQAAARARIAANHPGQGWSLLCNGVVLFDDGGALLPGGQAVAPATAGPVRTAA